jgi:hypothetical protein
MEVDKKKALAGQQLFVFAQSLGTYTLKMLQTSLLLCNQISTIIIHMRELCSLIRHLFRLIRHLIYIIYLPKCSLRSMDIKDCRTNPKEKKDEE